MSGIAALCLSTSAVSACASAAVARSAAVRTIPHSNKSLVSSRCCSDSADLDSISRAGRSICLISDSGVRATTRARSPCEIWIRPRWLRECIASRIAGRPTPKRSISSRSDGSASPTDNSPLRMSASSLSNTSSASFRRATGSPLPIFTSSPSESGDRTGSAAGIPAPARVRRRFAATFRACPGPPCKRSGFESKSRSSPPAQSGQGRGIESTMRDQR